MEESEAECPCCSRKAGAGGGKCRHCGGSELASGLLSAAPDVIEEAEVYETLVALCDKSLVSFDQESGRFHLLDSIREYGELRLHGAQDKGPTLARHADFYLTSGNIVDLRSSQSDRMAAIQRDLDNVRLALDWSSGQGSEAVERGLAMAANLESYWSLRGMVTECCCWLRRLLDQPLAVGSPVASRGRAIALANLGEVERLQGNDESARAYLREAVTMFEVPRDGSWRAFALNNLGWLDMLDGNLDAAFALHEQALEAAEASASKVQAAFSTTRMAAVAIEKGDLVIARSLLERAMEQWQETSLLSGTAHALVLVARIKRMEGDYLGAHSTLTECERLCLELGDLRVRVLACEELAELAKASGDPARAARLLGLLERLRPESGFIRHRNEAAMHHESLNALRKTLGEERLVAELAVGQLMP